VQHGTNPLNPDTDSDGMPDGWEVQYGLNPLDASDGDEDGDADGLTNLGEYQEGTDPTNPDTDSDGMPDGWEVQYGLDPLNPSDAGGDGDGDNLTNLAEHQAGTDPTNPGNQPPESRHRFRWNARRVGGAVWIKPPGRLRWG
jgi:hypothetical protein